MAALRTALLVLSLCICSAPVSGAAITEVRQSLAGTVADGSRSQKLTLVEDWSLSIPAVPDPFQVEGTDGNVFARGTANWSAVGGQLIISVDSNMYRTGAVDSIAGLAYELEFTVHEDTTYEMSGYLSVTDVAPTESGGVVLAANLGSLGPYSYSEQQLSANTHNEYFTLGGKGGDRGNFLEPGSSLNGALKAGRKYSLRMSYTVSNVEFFFPGGPDSGASAVGSFTFKIGTVPEPTSFALLAVAGVASPFRRRRTVFRARFS